MRRQATIIGGLLVVAAFALFAHTAGAGGRSAAPPSTAAQSANPPGGGAGGGGALPLGAPQSGAPGSGYVIVSGAVNTKYTFKQVSCIRSPNTPNGLLAKGSTDPNSPDPITVGVATDASTLSPIELHLSVNRTWTDGQGTAAPRIHRSDKTVTYSGQLRPGGHGGPVTVRGSLTCGAITTLG